MATQSKKEIEALGKKTEVVGKKIVLFTKAVYGTIVMPVGVVETNDTLKEVLNKAIKHFDGRKWGKNEFLVEIEGEKGLCFLVEIPVIKL